MATKPVVNNTRENYFYDRLYTRDRKIHTRLQMVFLARTYPIPGLPAVRIE